VSVFEGGLVKPVSIRWGAWYEDRDMELWFPGGWDVIECRPRDAEDIGDAGIAASFASPIGTPSLRQLAEGRRSPCIVIDDLSRPTMGHRLIPPILAELAAVGIPAEDVLILAGIANHRPMTSEDLRKKLGPVVLTSCRLSSHFSWDNCVNVGATSYGSPIDINAEFLASDLRILVGSIIPHGATGFSGGAKLLMPGIAGIDSATAFHKGTAARGGYATVANDARLETEEAARLAGVDFIVNSIPNSHMGIAGVVVGDVVDAHRAGVEIAKRVFSTPTPTGCDVGVFSLYPKDTEFMQHVTAMAPWKTAPEPIVVEDGTVVIAATSSEGLGYHSLFGPGMRLAAKRPTRVRGRDLVFFAPGMAPGGLSNDTRPGTVLLPTWEDTVAWLTAKHGAKATVAVFPCATMQLSEAVCSPAPVP
jgi:nickel-dependent lactate racemase